VGRGLHESADVHRIGIRRRLTNAAITEKESGGSLTIPQLGPRDGIGGVVIGIRVYVNCLGVVLLGKALDFR
jgi:hypothetical protein